MKFILILILTLTLSHANKLDDELKYLTKPQLEILHTTFKKAKSYDLQWTMTAMAWQESRFGKALIGRTTPDYGVFQINLKTFKARYAKILAEPKEDGTLIDDKDIINMLVSDYELNFVASLEEIKFWQHVHGNNYMKIWASYNGGFKGNPIYANAIKNKIRALRRYFARIK